MSEAVTDIIVSRSRQSDGLTSMVAWSVALHAVIAAGALLMPERQVDEAPRMVMTINLGGAPGPKTDGLNAMGDRSVQAVATEKPRVEPPPAPERPKMTLPTPNARPRPERPRPEQAPAESRSRTLSTGEEVRTGSTPTTTRTRGEGFGLATAGGLGGSIEVAGGTFCCPEYLAQVRDLIQRNYSPNQGFVGMTRMEFTLLRNGTLTNIRVDRPSGFAVLDLASRRALEATQGVPGLPQQYTNPTLTVYLYFEYRR